MTVDRSVQFTDNTKVEPIPLRPGSVVIIGSNGSEFRVEPGRLGWSCTGWRQMRNGQHAGFGHFQTREEALEEVDKRSPPPHREIRETAREDAS